MFVVVCRLGFHRLEQLNSLLAVPKDLVSIDMICHILGLYCTECIKENNSIFHVWVSWVWKLILTIYVLPTSLEQAQTQWAMLDEIMSKIFQQHKIWTCFEYCITKRTGLLKNRHLDQVSPDFFLLMSHELQRFVCVS